MTGEVLEGTDFRKAARLWGRARPVAEWTAAGAKHSSPCWSPSLLGAGQVTSRREMRVPLDFAVIPATIGLGSLIGRRAVIQPKRLDAEMAGSPEFVGRGDCSTERDEDPSLRREHESRFNRLAVRAQEMHDLNLERFRGPNGCE